MAANIIFEDEGTIDEVVGGEDSDSTGIYTHNAQKIKLGIPLRPAMGKQIQERLFSSLCLQMT